jgi:hypothetical protein
MRVLVCVPACSPRPCCVPVHWAPGVPALLTGATPKSTEAAVP